MITNTKQTLFHQQTEVYDTLAQTKVYFTLAQTEVYATEYRHPECSAVCFLRGCSAECIEPRKKLPCGCFRSFDKLRTGLAKPTQNAQTEAYVTNAQTNVYATEMT